jgi:hypothetical protein
MDPPLREHDDKRTSASLFMRHNTKHRSMFPYLRFVASALSLLAAGAGNPENMPHAAPDPSCTQHPASSICEPANRAPEEDEKRESAPPVFKDIIPPTYRDQNPPMGPPSV